MKRAMVIGGIAAVVATVAVIGIVGVMSYTEPSPRNPAQDTVLESKTFDQALGAGSMKGTLYENVQAAEYEFEIPASWQLQPSDAFVDSVMDAMILEASNGRMYDNMYYEYAEPKSLETAFVPTSIQLSTAKSDLTQDEYEDVMFEIVSLIGLAAGMDLRLIDSRQDTLGDKPAVTLEYVLVDVTDSGLPTIKAVETTTTVGSMMYSVSYVAELNGYDKHLHHFERAVETFRFK